MDRNLPQRQIASMERPTKAMLVAVALVCAIALSLHLWLWLEPACANPNRRLIMKAAGGVGCFEFWLNRYQGLIGNMLTALVAGATLIWVARQLGPADRQASAIAAQTLKTVAGELAQQQSTIDGIRKILLVCATRDRCHRPLIWDDIKRENLSLGYHFRQASSQMAHFDAVHLENGTPPMLRFTRELEAQLAKAKQAMIDFDHFRDAYESDLNEMVSEGHFAEFEEIGDRCAEAFAAAYEIVDRAYHHLGNEVRLAWREVRELEARAIGPWWSKRNIRTLLPDSD